MGAGNSTLSPEQKANISKSVKAKYELLQADSNLNHEDILRELSSVIEKSLDAIPSPPKPILVIDPNDENNTVGDSICITTSLRPEMLKTISPKPDDDHKASFVDRQKSSDLLLKNTSSFIVNSEKVASFINQLKDGDINTRRSSGFRIRRLTYAQKTAEEPETALPLSTKRTTIYSSKEIGVRQEKDPPFPPLVLGTFSCHGIEPAEYHHEEKRIEEEGDFVEDEDNYVEEIVEKTNQDRGCVVHPFNHSYQETLFMVLDGHGEQGDRVSEFCMRNIVLQLEKNLALYDTVEEALSESFITANSALENTPIKYMTSGSTCVSVYMRGDEYWVANCGDSRAVLASWNHTSGELEAHSLSRDHKPDDPVEMNRIEACGGFVSPSPLPGLSARVYLDPEFTMIGLAMARSLGDYAVKDVGVIPVPEILKYELDESDKFMIMASDGVWEFISSQEAVDIVHSNISMGAHFACQELIQAAALRWQEEEGNYRDDITAIVITFPLPSTYVLNTTQSNDIPESEGDMANSTVN